LANAILRGGGIRQWLWLGDAAPSPIGTIECRVMLRRGRQVGPLTYELSLSRLIELVWSCPRIAHFTLSIGVFLPLIIVAMDKGTDARMRRSPESVGAVT
jgi:hypothetical protein